MGLWPRLGVTTLAAAALTVVAWQGFEAVGGGQVAAIAVATIVATVAVTLGGVWAARARDSADEPGAVGGVTVFLPSSGQAMGVAHGPVFGLTGSFRGATFNVGAPASPAPDGLQRSQSGPAVPADMARAGRVVVGEVPQEPPAFQGRRELLALLTGSAEDGRRVSVVFAVTGLRGVGKSQLAAACARRRLDEGWPLVAWIGAGGRDELLTGFAQLAAELGLAGDAPDSAEAARRVRHWLESDGDQCLVVLDNAADADEVRPFLPAAGRAQVIVTSSRAELAALGAAVPVDVFTDGEAVRFLAERTGLDDEAGALQVARELGSLPLALAQAGAVIAGQRLDYGTFLSRLAAVDVARYLTRPQADPYPRGTAQAIIMAIGAARADDHEGLAGRLLAVLSVLSPAGVPRSWLAVAVDASPQAVDEALGRLATWSLTGWSVDGSVVIAHRLVLRVVREQAATGQDLEAAARAAITGLASMLPGPEDSWRYQSLMQEFTAQVTALSASLAGFRGSVSRQSEAGLLDLLADAGRYLAGLSDTRSVPLLEQVLADRQRVLGADHPDTLASRSDLAEAYRGAGRLDEAIELHARALADRERLLGADHPDTLASRSSLAEAHRWAGRPAEAVELHAQAVAERQRVLGADHPGTLASRTGLALSYEWAGRKDEAVVLYEQVLADRLRVLGADHPDTLASRHELAGAYLSAGRFADAVVTLEQVTADMERVLGADHPDTLIARVNLAISCQKAGRSSDAIALHEHVIADSERLLGPDHPSTLTSRRILADSYKEAGRTPDAITLLEQYLPEFRRVFGADHPETLSCRNDLAGAYESAGRLADAITLWEKALADARRALSAGHPLTRTISRDLAAAQADPGKPRRSL